MVLTKRALGANYVTGTGLLLSGMFVVLLPVGSSDPGDLLVGSVGAGAAIALASCPYWLERVGIAGDGIWRIAMHAGLGIGLVAFGSLLAYTLARTDGSGVSESTLLVSTFALGGSAGAVAGTIREFSRSTTTLTRSTEVLSRVLRHNLRNDMTVILGQLDQLDRHSSDASESTGPIRATIDDVAHLSEQARLVECAVTDRETQPIDAVACITDALEQCQQADGDVATELPDRAWVNADWMLEVAVRDVLETIRAHDCEAAISLTVEVDGSEVSIRIVDHDGHLSSAEIATLEAGVETTIQHSDGLELWIVRWIVIGYGGSITVADDPRTVTLHLTRARPVSFP